MTREQQSADPDGAPRRGEETVEPWARPVGAALAGTFTLALLALAGFYLYELAIGASDSPVRVVMSIVLRMGRPPWPEALKRRGMTLRDDASGADRSDTTCGPDR